MFSNSDTLKAVVAGASNVEEFGVEGNVFYAQVKSNDGEYYDIDVVDNGGSYTVQYDHPVSPVLEEVSSPIEAARVVRGILK